MISINDLYFKYKKSSMLLKNINYTFYENNIYLITGKNGVGKTTFIKILLNIIKPTQGNISYSKSPIISYLPDFNGLYEDLNILDNIKFRLALYNINIKEKITEYTRLMQKYSLLEYEKNKISQLSLGMKRKVAIIATILVDANVYILDEPTGGMDKDAIEEFIQLMNEVKMKEAVVICITHEEELIKKLNSTILQIRNGELLCIS